MKKIIYVLSAMFISLNCAFPATLFSTPQPTVENTPVSDYEDTSPCANYEITDADRDTIVDYKKSLFSEIEWSQSYSVQSDQAIVIYSSDPFGAIAVLKTLALCNAKYSLETYATEENINIIMSNYQNYEQIASCKKDGVLLFQFTSLTNDINYDINIWVSTFNQPNRALEVFLAFPQYNAVNMEEYSKAFFPDFISCT